VDDQAVNLHVVRLMLEQAGHAVDVADSGGAAVALARQRLYDVVLTDVHMPEMDGFEVGRAIREALSPAWQPYVVALTANAFPEHIQGYADAGMDFLAKPVRPASLNAVLMRADAARVAVDGASAAAFRRLGAADPAVMRGALEAFFSSTQALVERLALDARDLPVLERAAHAIAGNAAGVGAFGLARAAAATERAARDADPVRAGQCAAAIAALWPRARVVIAGVLGSSVPLDPSASVDTPAARV
jgi:CheY-like chemotaxis protein